MSAALRRWSNGISAGKRGQRDTGLIRELFNLMPSALRPWKTFVFGILFAGIAPAILAQNSYAPQGGEYPIAGSLPGDQGFLQFAHGPNGGFLVWQSTVPDRG